MELHADTLVGFVDEVSEIGRSEPVALTAARGGYLTVRGWMFDRGTQRPADSITIRLNDGVPIEAVVGLSRPDVGETFGLAAAGSGFAAAVPILAPLGPGSLSIESRVGGRTSVTEIPNVVRIVGVPDPFAGAELRGGSWAFAIDGLLTDGDTPLARDPDGVWTIPLDRSADVRLWVVDMGELLPPLALVARFGGRHLRIESTIERLDVATSLGAPEAAYCGFTIPLMPSPIGTEHITIYALDRTGGYGRLTSIQVRRAAPLPAALLPATAAIAGAVDDIAVGSVSLPPGTALVVDPGVVLRVCGWVIDAIGPRLSGGIEVLVDGQPILESQTAVARPDVASSFANRGVMDCGFDISFALPTLAPGAHDVALRVLSARRDATALLTSRKITVRQGGRPR